MRLGKLKGMRSRVDAEMSRIVAENYDALSASMLDGGTLVISERWGARVVLTTETHDGITHLMEVASAQRSEVASRWPELKAALKQAADRVTAERDTKQRDEAARHNDEVRNRVLFVTREVEFVFERSSCLRRLRIDLPSNWLSVHDSPSTQDKELAAAVVTLYEKPRLTTQTVAKDSTAGFGRGGRALRGLKALTGADKIEVSTITAMNLEVTVTAPNVQKRSARWDVVLPEADQPSFAANNPEDRSRALTELWQQQCDRLVADLKLAPAK